MKRYILAIDEGTTSTRAVIVDKLTNFVASCSREFTQIYPKPGWVEHDPDEIWKAVEHTIKEVIGRAKISPSEIAAIGITNQRETTVVWDRSNGKPIHNAIVWQCRRTAEICAEIKRQGREGEIAKRTGLLADPYFSGTKIAWLLDNIEGARARAERGELKFGTIDTFLVDRLTAGSAHVTDVTNASRTMLMNLSTLAWDDEMLSMLKVPRSMLPRIEPSSTIFGTTSGLGFLPDGIPIAGIAGDQQAALFGQTCFAVNEAKITYGTGAFLLVNTGGAIPVSRNRLITTVAWKLGGATTYALEGSAFIAGAIVQWLRDGLGIIGSSAEVERLAAEVPDSGGAYLVPALAGLGAPYWRPEAKGIMTGLTRGTTRAHLARAALEGIAFEVYDILKAMESDTNGKIASIKVDGGASANNLLMQFQSDIMYTEVVRPHNIETTVLGAAFLAGLAVGIWTGIDELKSSFAIERTFTPSRTFAETSALISGWHRAVEKA